jgi:phasin family protein
MTTTTAQVTPDTAPQAPVAAAPHKLDLRGILDKLRVPGLDVHKLVDHGRKDIEALLAANEHAFTTIEVLTRKQTDLLANLVREWQAGARDTVSSASGAEKLNHAAMHAQLVFTQTLTRMREMAEIAAKSNADLLAMLTKRYHEGIAEVRSSVGRKP